MAHTRRTFLAAGLTLGIGVSAGMWLGGFEEGAPRRTVLTVLADAYASYPSVTDPGFCVLMETARGDRMSGLLFDCGLDGARFEHALDRCGISPICIDAVVISHGHPDHARGAPSVLEFLHRFDPSVPVYVPAGVFGDDDLLDRFDRYPLKRVAQKTEVVPGVFATGPLSGQPDSDWPGYDDELDEQALFLELEGRGLVVISACSHRSLESAVATAILQSGVRKVHAVIGGTHHEKAPARTVQDTIDYLRSVQPARIVPMHCTGMESIATLMRAFPETFPFHQRQGLYRVDSQMVFA